MDGDHLWGDQTESAQGSVALPQTFLYTNLDLLAEHKPGMIKILSSESPLIMKVIKGPDSMGLLPDGDIKIAN